MPENELLKPTIPDIKPQTEGNKTIWVALITAVSVIVVGYLGYLGTRSKLPEPPPDLDLTFAYTGTVRNTARQPIPNALISITEDQNPPLQARTDSEGVFFTRLSKKTATIWLIVTAHGYTPYTLVARPVRSGPQDFELQPESSPSRSTEHLKTVEGEFPGQFANQWDVTFDGTTFSCPPSPAYGETLCKAVASTRVVQRFQTTDNNPCTFYGTVDGDFVKGTYTCSRVKGTFEWHATILRASNTTPSS